MKQHTARDKDNNWQYENTVHLWIQLSVCNSRISACAVDTAVPQADI